MRFDLIRPCKHCPFANTETRLNFACTSRAEEIEEIAFRQGFVCHQHGESVEIIDEDGDAATHIDFREDGSSQHCFGALAMYLNNGSGNVPWEYAIEEDPELEERWWKRADPEALRSVFESETDFFEANRGDLDESTDDDAADDDGVRGIG